MTLFSFFWISWNNLSQSCCFFIIFCLQIQNAYRSMIVNVIFHNNHNWYMWVSFFQHCLMLMFHSASWVLSHSYSYSYFCCEIWIHFCFQKSQSWEHCWISCSCFCSCSWSFWWWVDSWFDSDQFCWSCLYLDFLICSSSFEWMMTVNCKIHWWIDHWHIICSICTSLSWISQEYHENLQYNFVC